MLLSFASLLVEVVKARFVVGEIHYRIEGIDAPEHRGKCLAEKQLAQLSTQHLENALANRPQVALRKAGRDKYGRTLVRVYINDVDYNIEAVRAGYAVE